MSSPSHLKQLALFSFHTIPCLRILTVWQRDARASRMPMSRMQMQMSLMQMKTLEPS